MTAWTSEELNRIGTAREIELAALQSDGRYQNPVTIWVVRVSDGLYIRSYKGQRGIWFQRVQERYEGRIWAAGIEKDVAFVEETGTEINDQIDAAYRDKYPSAPQYVSPMLVPEVRATTLKLVPRLAGT